MSPNEIRYQPLRDRSTNGTNVIETVNSSLRNQRNIRLTVDSLICMTTGLLHSFITCDADHSCMAWGGECMSGMKPTKIVLSACVNLSRLRGVSYTQVFTMTFENISVMTAVI